MTRDEIAATMAMVAADCEADARKPVAFSALGIGTIHGEMLAQIAAVACAVKLLAEATA